MAEELEKTCENCKYDYEDMEGTHCRHCIHSAEERFEPKEKETSETEIRNKAIDEYLNLLCEHCMKQENVCYSPECPFAGTDGCEIIKIAERMKGGGKDA